MRSWSWFCLRIGFAGVVSVGAVMVCGCHETALVYGPVAPPSETAPTALSVDSDQAERHKVEKNKLPGIPFYNHYGVCTRETVWLEPQTTLTLTVTSEGEKSVTKTMTLNNLAFHDSGEANDLVAHLSSLSGDHVIDGPDSPYCPAVAAKDWQDVAMKKEYKVSHVDESATISDKANTVVVTNTADIGTAVDYSRIYYLNAKSPLNGTSSVDAKLNPDGTLGEGNVSKDDETLSTVLTTLATLGGGALSAWSTVDAASITGNATVNAAAAAAATAAPAAGPFAKIGGKPAGAKKYACEADGWPGVQLKGKVTYDFNVAPGGFLHDHKRVEPITRDECVGGEPITGGSYTVTAVKGGDKPDKTAYTVSGTITPPKPPKDAAKQ